MAPPPMHDSAISPCFHGFYNLLPHIPLMHLSAVNISPHPGIGPQSLNSSSQPPHLPGDLHPCPGYAWLQQGLSILIPFRLPQTSYFTSALNVSPLTQTIALMWGLDSCFSSPTHRRQVQSYYHSCFPPYFLCPTKFCVVLYIRSPGQVLLSALSWCYACTSVSAGVFLMCPWTQMYSMSDCSSAIFSSVSNSYLWSSVTKVFLSVASFRIFLYL